MNAQVNIVQNRTVVVDSHWRFRQSVVFIFRVTQKMDAAVRLSKHQSLSTFRKYVHQDNHTPPTYEMTLGFKPFTK